jgi:hypothetical protein
MITLIAVAFVFAIGGYGHYASLDGRKVLALCLAILAIAMTVDFFIDYKPTRFGQ